MSSAKAASLKGRLGLADGRAIRRLVNELLLETTKIALRMVGERIAKAGPRRVDANTGEVLYTCSLTRASRVKPGGGLGAVLIDQTGSVVNWFGCPAPRICVTRSWLMTRSKRLVSWRPLLCW